MEAAAVWKAAMKPRLPTRLGKRYAFRRTLAVVRKRKSRGV